MTFNPNARLDPGEVEDVRGGGGFGGFGGFGGRGIAVGGGGIGLLVAIVYLLLGGSPSNLGVTSPGVDYGPGSSALAQECQTGSQANAIEDCRIVGYVNSIQAYWQNEFSQNGQSYQQATTVLFSGSTTTGCGDATTEVGPFYCPNDGHVYLDLGFFDELRTRFGATAGPAAQAYVVAHEYGHHVQDLLGALSGGQGTTGANGTQVQIELQADCYAGVWASHAASTGYLEPLTKAQIADALNAATAVGDDRIQKETQGRVNPETWTHGSSAQRENAFTTGYNGGSPGACQG